jgi:hypothetical protein
VKNETQFEQWLRQGFGNLNKGPCPDAVSIERFMAGLLSDEEESDIRSHIAACGRCDLLLARMRRFEQVEEPAFRQSSQKVSRLAAAFSLCLVLALVYPAFLGLKNLWGPDASVVHEPPPIESSETLQLDVTRNDGKLTTPGGSQPKIILSFFVPIEPNNHYLAVVLDGGGHAVLAETEVTSYDTIGNFSLLVDRRKIPSGKYILKVRSREAPQRVFTFPFTL